MQAGIIATAAAATFHPTTNGQQKKMKKMWCN